MQRLGLGEPALLREGLGGVEPEPGPLGMPGREQGGGAPQQVRRRRDVASGERSAPRGREVAAPSHADLPDLLVVAA